MADKVWVNICSLRKRPPTAATGLFRKLAARLQRVQWKASDMTKTPNDPIAKNHENEILFEETSLEELQQLSAALLENPTTSSILRKAGIHGDFSAEGEASVDKEIETFAEQRGWGQRAPLLLALSITLARWVADGKISAADCHEAVDFLEDRYLKRAGDYHGFRSKKPFPSEILMVARALKANPMFWAAIEQAGERGDIDKDYWEQTLYPIQYRICLKYGLQNRGVLTALTTALLRKVADEIVPNLDHPEAVKFVSSNKALIRKEVVS